MAAAVELEPLLLFLVSLTPADLPGSTIAIQAPLAHLLALFSFLLVLALFRFLVFPFLYLFVLGVVMS
jgi:hypothetical protein